MTTSFDDKVEALRKLQEKRQARLNRNQDGDNVTSTAASGYPTADGAAQKPPVAAATAAEVEGKELTDVLERYARLQGPAKSSLADSCGAMFAKGLARETDDSAAPQDNGDEADALYCLGHCMEQGLHDQEQDKSRAAVYYRLAAEKGSVVGQWRLGHLHEYGEGVEASDDYAAHWYRLAAEGGNPQAMTSLALLLEDGRVGLLHSGARDDAEALRWHLQAAEQNQALSQYCAACCLAEGRGALQDPVAAKKWLEKSAGSGFPLAVEALEKGKLWNHAEIYEDAEVGEDGGSQSLMDMAARVASQIGHLSDAEADEFLEELMGNLDVDDPCALGDEELTRILAGEMASDMDLESILDKSRPEFSADQCAVVA